MRLKFHGEGVRMKFADTEFKEVLDGELEPSVQSQREANEAFARKSARKNGIDSGRPTEDEMSKMTPIERFCAASAARNRLNPRYADEARRRRRSE
jgi:hypothetical protein